MSRETPVSGTPLTAPRDGVRSSVRRRGWLAEAWLGILAQFDASSKARISRGRSLARGGRVRDLWFSPGLANAEVVERETRHVSFRVRVYDEASWRRVVKLLKARLDFVAALLEGELPRELVETFAQAGLPLIPTASDFDCDCDCGDYALPCAHMAAVHILLADALDGDPFLLLMLRGRPREQVLAALRGAWGDKKPLVSPKLSLEEEVGPELDWYASPTALPSMDFQPMVEADAAPLGLRELGPAPGGEDLGRVLAPLYEAGAAIAEQIALADEPVVTRRSFLSSTTDMAPRRRVSSVDPAMLSFSAPKWSDPVAGESSDDDLVEAIVDILSDGNGYRARDIAENLGVELAILRRELREMELLDTIRRTGRTRGTRWWLR